MGAFVTYVIEHATRGDCQCGKCIISNGTDTAEKPSGHTLDLTFFQVGMKGEPTREEFIRLAHDAGLCDENGGFEGEKSYIEWGGEIGDQGVALCAIGLGHLLGAWKCLCPATVLPPGVPKELAQQLAGVGLVSAIQRRELEFPDEATPEQKSSTST